MKRIFSLLVIILSLYFTVFATPAQAQCNEFPQSQCGNRCGHFDNCGGEASRPDNSWSCVDKHYWNGTCCFNTGSEWQQNAMCGGGESESVAVKGKVLGCQGQPLQNVTVYSERWSTEFGVGWSGSPDTTTATDSSGNYSISSNYKEGRVFRVQINNAPGDTRTYKPVGSIACRGDHQWCEHDTIKTVYKGTADNINFQQTNCQPVGPVEGPSCKSLAVTGGSLVGGIRNVPTVNTSMTFTLTGTPPASGSIARNQICFYPNTLADKNDWSLGWFCISANPLGTNPYTVTKTFQDIKVGIRARDPNGQKVTDVQLDADGVRYSGAVHAPDGTFCDGGSKWTGVGNSLYNACTFNSSACAGKIDLGTVVPLAKTCSVSSTDPSTITTTQTKKISVTGNSSRSTSEPTRLVISKNDFSRMEAPPSGTKETPSGGRYFYIFQSQIANLTNNSFETGNTSGWAGSSGNLKEFWAVDGNQYPSAADGRYYLKVMRETGGDAFVVSNWIETNSDVTGQRFNLSFMAKSHIDNAEINKIKGIIIQRCSSEACSSPAESSNNASFGDIDLSSTWKPFNRDVIFPNPSNGATTTKVRVVLRLPDYANVPIYYDKITLTRASGSFFNCSTSSGVACTASATLSGLQAGDYSAHCDLPTDPGKCSGNPACNYEGCSGQPYCTDCTASGWVSCSNTDSLKFTVAPVGCTDADPQPITSMSIASVTGGIESAQQSLSGNLVAPTKVDMPAKTSSVKFHWTHPVSSSNTKYEVVVFKQGSFASVAEAHSAALAGNALARLYTVNAPAGSGASRLHVPPYQQNYQLSVAIRAINDDTCAGIPDKTTYWSRYYFNLLSEMEGNFKVVTTNSCVGGSSANPEGKVKDVRNAGNVVRPNAIGQEVGGASSYTISEVPFTPTSQWGSNKATLKIENIDPTATSAYICAACNRENPLDVYNCVAHNPFPVKELTTPSVNNNFYLLQISLINDPWWQVVNGLAYAGGAMSSNIPDTCGSVTDPTCIKSLITRALGSTEDQTSGLPLTKGGSIFKGTGTFSQNNNSRSTGLDFKAIDTAPEDYAYFANKVSLSGAQLADMVGAKSGLSGGTTDPSDSTKILHKTGNLTIKPSGTPISIANNEKYVVFVDGNLTVDGDPETKVFEVAEGGYLGFIVKGTITFSKNIGYTITDTNKSSNLLPNISGVFVANQIVVSSDGPDVTKQDLKFVGEGTYVGWSGISLNRDFASNNAGKRFHNGDPTELFIYRPSYLENTPNVLKSSGMLWQEVN